MTRLDLHIEGLEIMEMNIMPDHVYLGRSIIPKMSVSEFVGTQIKRHGKYQEDENRKEDGTSSEAVLINVPFRIKAKAPTSDGGFCFNYSFKLR
jgi:REP element-mobilizing transposase RayT